MGLFSNRQQHGNMPVCIVLAKPQVWSLQVLDTLTQLDHIVLGGCHPLAKWRVLYQPCDIFCGAEFSVLVKVLEERQAVVLDPRKGFGEGSRWSIPRWIPGSFHDSYEILTELLASSTGSWADTERNNLSQHAVHVRIGMVIRHE